jgi:phenylacetate-CoA ligase
MFILRGCNIFPMQIEGILMKIPEVGDDYRITLETINDQDEMTIDVEIRKECFRGDLVFLGILQKRLTHLVRDEVLVTPVIRLVEPGSIPKAEGKAIRVFDKRKR